MVNTLDALVAVDYVPPSAAALRGEPVPAVSPPLESGASTAVVRPEPPHGTAPAARDRVVSNATDAADDPPATKALSVLRVPDAGRGSPSSMGVEAFVPSSAEDSPVVRSAATTKQPASLTLGGRGRPATTGAGTIVAASSSAAARRSPVGSDFETIDM